MSDTRCPILVDATALVPHSYESMTMTKANIVFTSLHSDYVTGAAFDGVNYMFIFASDRSFIDLYNVDNDRKMVRKDHKLALRAEILAAYQHATRGVDLGVQHNDHVPGFFIEQGRKAIMSYGVDLGVQHNAHTFDRDRHDIAEAFPEPHDAHCWTRIEACEDVGSAYDTATIAKPVQVARKASKRRPVITRGLASLALALSIAASPMPAIAYELPSNALMHRVAMFKASMHDEGNGERNCMPRQCDKLLKRFGLTWSLIREAIR